MTKSLSGKSAMVTGGSRGIGAAIVRRLASDGAAVAFTYFASEAKAAALVTEIEANGGRALAINADSAGPQARMVKWRSGIENLAVPSAIDDVHHSRHTR